MNINKKSSVSVVMITYGHEKFIAEAINGVLMQECEFDVELIISNDYSPDNTDLVVKKIIEEHPNRNWIKYVKHKTNLGMMPNFIWALEQTKGKYIALCEGDDYWTDPLKLQKQVDFLEANIDYSMCFHQVEITMANVSDYYSYPLPSSETLYLKDIIQKHYIPTCSLVFRSKFFSKGFPEWMVNSISGDIPLEILLASKGKAKYFPQKMACYRRNEGGITQSPIQLAKMRSGYIYMYSKLSKEIGFSHAIYLHYIVWRLKLGYLKIFFKRIKSFFR